MANKWLPGTIAVCMSLLASVHAAGNTTTRSSTSLLMRHVKVLQRDGQTPCHTQEHTFSADSGSFGKVLTVDFTDYNNCPPKSEFRFWQGRITPTIYTGTKKQARLVAKGKLVKYNSEPPNFQDGAPKIVDIDVDLSCLGVPTQQIYATSIPGAYRFTQTDTDCEADGPEAGVKVDGRVLRNICSTHIRTSELKETGKAPDPVGTC